MTAEVETVLAEAMDYIKKLMVKPDVPSPNLPGLIVKISAIGAFLGVEAVKSSKEERAQMEAVCRGLRELVASLKHELRAQTNDFGFGKNS